MQGLGGVSGSPQSTRTREGAGEALVPAEEGWTSRLRRGEQPASPLYPCLNSCVCMLAAPSRDWNVFQADFCRSLAGVSAAHPANRGPTMTTWWPRCWRVAIRKKMGYLAYRCLHGGQGTLFFIALPMSCQSSLCLRCARSCRSLVSQVSKVLHEGGIYRHIILTVPAMYPDDLSTRTRRRLKTAFMRCGGNALMISLARAGKPSQAVLTVLHAPGRNGQYHPHWHVLAIVGAMMPRGRAGSISSTVPYELLRRKWPCTC